MEQKIMKKIFLLCFLLIIITGRESSAADISIGATGWYAQMDFVDDSNMEMEPAFLYGPLLNISFLENWGVSFVVLYGKVKSKEEEDGFELKRIDSDTLLNYNFNKYFKIFTGCKYMSYAWGGSDDGGIHYSVGPGLGLGVTLPLGGNFYLLGNFSGVYLWGKHKEDSSSSEEEEGRPDWETDMVERGFNTKLSFAYYISAASTSINLGFRYQYSKFIYKDSTSYSEDSAYMFYGITLSAVYSFEI